MPPQHHREVFQCTLFNEFSKLFWHGSIYYLFKQNCNQTMIFVNLRCFCRFAHLFAVRIVTICFRDRVYITTTFLTWVHLYTHVKHISRPIIGGARP